MVKTLSRMLTLVALSMIAVFSLAANANAAYYVYPSLHNGGTTAPDDNIIIHDVTWSGSYYPQIASPVAPSSTNSGTFHTVQQYGYSYLTFYATFDDAASPANTCLFTFSVNNSTGAVSGAVASHTSGNNVTCSVPSSTSVNFTMSRP